MARFENSYLVFQMEARLWSAFLVTAIYILFLNKFKKNFLKKISEDSDLCHKNENFINELFPEEYRLFKKYGYSVKQKQVDELVEIQLACLAMLCTSRGRIWEDRFSEVTCGAPLASEPQGAQEPLLNGIEGSIFLTIVFPENVNFLSIK